MRTSMFLYFVVFLACQATAQIRLNGYGAYAFDDRIESYSSPYRFHRGTLQGGLVWGAGLEYKLRPAYSMELLYQRLDAEAPMTFANGSTVPTSKVFEYSANFIFLGGLRFLDIPSESVEPFAGFLGGAAIYQVSNPEPGGDRSLTRFAWGARLGTNIWLNTQVAVKLQAQVISVVQAFGGSAYLGTGGSGVALDSYSTMFQFNLGGGLVFKMRKPQ